MLSKWLAVSRSTVWISLTCNWVVMLLELQYDTQPHVTFECCMKNLAPIHFYHATLCISVFFVVGRCLSVHHVRVLYLMGLRYHQLFSRPDSPIVLVSWGRLVLPNSKGNPLNTWGGKDMLFSTEITVCLRNGTRLAQGCYGTLIGSRRWWIDLRQFRWPWVSSKDGMRGVQFFGRISLITLVPFDLERPNSAR